MTRHNGTVLTTLPANPSQIGMNGCSNRCNKKKYWQNIKIYYNFISLCYRQFRFFIGRIFLLLVYFQSISRVLGVGNCLFLHACPGVGNRTVERKLQIPRGVPGGGEGVVTARIEPYANPPKVIWK